MRLNGRRTSRTDWKAALYVDAPLNKIAVSVRIDGGYFGPLFSVAAVREVHTMKFTLRDLFWLTLVAALAVGWYRDHRWDDGQNASIQVCSWPLTGDVLAVSNTGLVEISLGSDDCLKIGNQLWVTRGNRYVARITIRSLSPDRAIGQIDTKPQRGKIQQGDKVSTTLG